MTFLQLDLLNLDLQSLVLIDLDSAKAKDLAARWRRPVPARQGEQCDA